MSNSNLGLNRKISSVMSKNLTDTESDIYKQISEIASEYTVEEDPIREYVITKIETGIEDRDDILQLTSFIDDTITAIPDKLFEDCVNLSEITIPSVQKMGTSCFRNCSGLTELYLPGVTKQIGLGSFEDCVNLKKVILPNFNLIEEEIDPDILLPRDQALNGRTWNVFTNAEYLTSAFLRCNNIETLIIGTTTITILLDLTYNRKLKILCLPKLEYIKRKSMTNLDVEYLILPGETIPIVEYYHGGTSGESYDTGFNGVFYVPDNMVEPYRDSVYFNKDRWWSTSIHPISELPDEIKQEIRY